MPTKPVTVPPNGLKPEPLLGIAFPSPARLPVVFFLVSLPPGATLAREMPAGIIDTAAEILSEVA